MKKKNKLILAAALTTALLMLEATAAAAYTGIVTKNVNLRAGPDNDYPIVAKIRRNSAVEIYGCVYGWRWCDIAAGPYRGWIRGDFLYARRYGRNVQIIEAGPAVNVPIISFNFGYWDTHYRTRNFYRERATWERRHPTERHDDRYDRRDDRRDDRHDHYDHNDWRYDYPDHRPGRH